jgi:hypothetical protein
MKAHRLAALGTVLAVCLGLGACGGSSTSPKLQMPNASGGKPGSTVIASRPLDKDLGKPGDKSPTAVGQSQGADPAKITKANFDMVKLGMDEKEVMALLGKPSSEKPTADGKGRVCTWEDGKKVISATFRDNRLAVISSDNLDDK